MAEQDDFRGRRKKVSINSADAEAWIRAQREARQEFEKNEGRPLHVHDGEMDRLHGEHAAIAANEQAQQRDLREKHREDDKRREEEQQVQQQPESEQAEQEQGRSM